MRTVTFTSATDTPTINFVEICPNGLILRDKNGTLVGQASGWVIPKGAPKLVKLPI